MHTELEDQVELLRGPPQEPHTQAVNVDRSVHAQSDQDQRLRAQSNQSEFYRIFQGGHQQGIRPLRSRHQAHTRSVSQQSALVDHGGHRMQAHHCRQVPNLLATSQQKHKPLRGLLQL